VLERRLATPQEPKLVRGNAEHFNLLLLQNAGKSKEVRAFLERRAREAVRFWERRLGMARKRRGRPRDWEERKRWKLCAALHARGITIPQLARVFYSKMDQTTATDRLRKGIRAVQSESEMRGFRQGKLPDRLPCNCRN